MLVIHKFEDYDKWKKVFDEHGTVRKAKESQGATIFQDANDPKQIVIILMIGHIIRPSGGKACTRTWQVAVS